MFNSINFSLLYISLEIWCKLKVLNKSSDDQKEWIISFSRLLRSKAWFCLFGNREYKINASSVKRSGEDEIGTIFLKSDHCDLACDHSQIIILYMDYITQVYCTLNLFTKLIVIFKIWMDNWGMSLANLEQVVREEKCRTNRMI